MAQEKMKMQFLRQRTHVSAAQGASEERTELYILYSEGAPQLATPRSATSNCGVSGCARKQANCDA